MKRWSGFLPQHQHPFLAMYTGTETSDAPRKMGLSDMVMLCVRQVKDSPYYLLYFICQKKSTLILKKIKDVF